MQKNIYNFTIFSGGLFLVLTCLAMVFFPGGTVQEASYENYRFLENFFSDLGRTQDFEGGTNVVSMVLFMIALTIVGISTALFMWQLPSVLPNDKWSRILKNAMCVLGIIAGIGFIGVAFTPWDLVRPTHVMFVNIAFRCLLIATLCLMICIYKSPQFPNWYAHLLAGTSIVLLGYVLLLIFGPAPESGQQGLMIQVVCQKIVVYLLIISTTVQAFGAKIAARKLGL